MSDVLNKASLVLIPSGYKEDKIYSVIPTNGDGDLTFTRASDATRVNSQGLVERVAWNLAEYSEDLSNGIYTKTNVTITTNTTTAPNGTLTADTLSATATNGNIQGVVSVVVGTTYTMSVWLKRKTGTGTVQLRGVSNTSTTVSITNEWARYSVTLTATDTNGRYGVLLNTSGDEVYAWGFQLNEGTLKPYFPTTDRLNVPRLDYSGGSCPSLLLEPQRTNLFQYSEQFDNAYWTKSGATITANNTTSPDGYVNADKFTENGATGNHLFYNTPAITASATSTFSVFYKKGTRRYFSIKLQIGSNSYTQVFDSDLLATTSSSSNGLTGVSTSIVAYANGWVRASLSGTDPLGLSACYGIASLSNSDTPTFDPSNYNPTYQGSSSEYGYFWGAQLEVGSYPTSYIPTTSSAATRVADAASKTGISSLIGQTEGTIFLDFDFTNISAIQVLISIHDNASNKRLEIWANNDLLYGFIGGSASINIANTAITNGRHRAAIAYKSTDSAFYVDGVHIGTSTTAFTIAALTVLSYSQYTGLLKPTEKVNQTLLFKTRLTNSELASLTGNQNYTINQAYASYGVASESPNCVQP